MSQPERIRLWEAEHGPIPSEMKLAWTCKVGYCGKPWHMELKPRQNLDWNHYVQYRPTFEALALGEYLEIPNVVPQGSGEVNP